MLECEVEQMQQQQQQQQQQEVGGGGGGGSVGGGLGLLQAVVGGGGGGGRGGGGGGGGGREGGMGGEKTRTKTRHYLKPLPLIWSRFPHFDWTENNTLMVDDKEESFALSQHNGVKVREFRREEVWREGGQGGREGGREELVWLATYLEEVGREWHAQGRAVSSAVPGREGGGGGAWPHGAWRQRGRGVV